MAGYRLVGVTRANPDWYTSIADDPRIRTVDGFVRAFRPALGLKPRQNRSEIYDYLEVQSVGDDVDDYDVIDSWSAGKK